MLRITVLPFQIGAKAEVPRCDGKHLKGVFVLGTLYCKHGQEMLRQNIAHAFVFRTKGNQLSNSSAVSISNA